MDSTLAVVAISVMSPIIAITLYSFFKERGDERKIAYKKWKARFDNQHPKAKAPAAAAENKGLGGLIAGLDREKIGSILETLQDNTYEDEDESGGIEGLLTNPAIQSAISGLLSKPKDKGEQQEETKYL